MRCPGARRVRWPLPGGRFHLRAPVAAAATRLAAAAGSARCLGRALEPARSSLRAVGERRPRAARASRRSASSSRRSIDRRGRARELAAVEHQIGALAQPRAAPRRASRVGLRRRGWRSTASPGTVDRAPARPGAAEQRGTRSPSVASGPAAGRRRSAGARFGEQQRHAGPAAAPAARARSASGSSVQRLRALARARRT